MCDLKEIDEKNWWDISIPGTCHLHYCVNPVVVHCWGQNLELW